ncbi:MAG: phosphate/phosphite/phosphonate ABC transporter substrate-binding protein [Thermodesulfovibrionales bacterium]|nr:phosphate/phosphite/phosphonate ABC transporter substrate-binding protein [Thermodesulfovibrionales bacterium]
MADKVKKSLILFFVIFFGISCTSPSAKDERRSYKIGYMICNSEYETLHRFRPLTAYLSQKLGVNFEAVAIDTVDFTKEVDKLDFTHTNSLLYIIMNRNHGLGIIAAEKAGSLGARSRGIIIALKKSGIKNLKDLKRKTMIFGPMLGPTSYMSQLDILLKNGIDPDNDLALYSIPSGTYKHEKVIYGVLFGKYDAGAVPLLDFERTTQEGKIEKQDFTVIAEGESIPYCNFGVTQKVDDSLVRKFKKALLDIKKDDTVEIDGEVVKVLERAQIDGYEDIKDKDFDVVREMAKRTNMPPYQKY